MSDIMKLKVLPTFRKSKNHKIKVVQKMCTQINVLDSIIYVFKR